MSELRLIPLVPNVIGFTSDDPKAPGFGWQMSERCRRDLEAIEENRRRAAAIAHTIWFRARAKGQDND